MNGKMEDWQIEQTLKRLNNDENMYIKVKNRAAEERCSMYKIIEKYGDPYRRLD